MLPRPSHRGFSFIEILFAVAVMSIGLIGIASALYVGVDQTKTTLDETAAAGVAREAAATLTQLMTQANTPESGPLFNQFDGPATIVNPPNPVIPSVAALVKPNQISSADPRYAWMPLYRRGAGSMTADVVIGVARASAQSTFGPSDLADVATPFTSSVVPVKVQARLILDTTTNETLLEVNDSGSNGGHDAVSSGSFVFLGGSASGGLPPHIARLSERVGVNIWSLVPGEDLVGLPTGGASVAAYAFGRGYRDPAHPELGYTGDNQAIAVYTTIVLLR